MPTPTLDTRPDGSLVIEAATAAEALASIGERLGLDAEILAAEKVYRGGWRGFFARELVQLTARSRETPEGDPPPAAAETSGGLAGVAAPGAAAMVEREAPVDRVAARLEQLVRLEEARDTCSVDRSVPHASFRDALVRELGSSGRAERAVIPTVESSVELNPVRTDEFAVSGPTTVLPAELPVGEPVMVGADALPGTPTSTVWEDVPTGMGRDASSGASSGANAAVGHAPATPSVVGVDWHVDHLRRLHLPSPVVDACVGLDPRDDAAWLLAIAGAVSSWCRPLPERDAVYIGPRAHRLAAGLGLATARPGAIVPTSGSVGLRTSATTAGRTWVDEVQADRWRHLVVGGARWETFLLDDVTAVSWVGDEALPAALECAGRLGLILGYGCGGAIGKSPVRATPLDVALTIRSLLPRHV